jgi:hypothetical protein
MVHPMTSNVETQTQVVPEQTTLAETVAVQTGEQGQATIEDQVAKTYDSLVPVWDRFAENASKKALIRVVKAAIKWPLQDKVPKFQNKAEFEAFKILCTILDCKTVMISAVLEERLKKSKGDESGKNTEEKMA